MVAAVLNLKKLLSEHRPVLTCIGMNQRGLPEMHVETEVFAND